MGPRLLFAFVLRSGYVCCHHGSCYGAWMSRIGAHQRPGNWCLIATALSLSSCGGAAPQPERAEVADKQPESRALPRPDPGAPLQKPPRSPPTELGTPLGDVSLFVDPDSLAMQALHDAEEGDRVDDAKTLSRIARAPQAVWLGDWTADPYAFTDKYLTKANSSGNTGILVVAGLPAVFAPECIPNPLVHSEEKYRRRTREIQAAIGDRSAILVLEPLAFTTVSSELTANYHTGEVLSSRIAALRDALLVYRQSPNLRLYLDGGQPALRSPAEAAEILTTAGIEHAHGFSLNTSAFRLTSECLDYGRELSSILGGAHFVIDTSRNGVGPYLEAQNVEQTWCNPPGRKLGARPTTDTGEPLCDAFLWLKRPGESDGECNGGPRAGVWWDDHALSLAR